MSDELFLTFVNSYMTIRINNDTDLGLVLCCLLVGNSIVRLGNKQNVLR